ncbi:MAG: metal-dependent hydrolase [Planctomycetota bacterium]
MTYLGRETTFQWLGHSTFVVGTPSGKRVIIDPWLDANPSCPAECKDPGPIDLVLVTHGHFDHLSDAAPLAKKHKAQVVANFEVGSWLEKQGVTDVIAMNKGGTVEVAGLQVTMTNAFHSGGISDGDRIIYGGEPAGYVVETESEFRFYHAGDTCVFGDMALIKELYEPSLAMLPIGDHFTMGPREAAKAAHLLGVQVVIPMHYGTFDLLTGTPEKLRVAIGALPIQVVELQPGEMLE